MSDNPLVYCIRRGRDGTHCRTQTHSKDGVCSGCKGDLQELLEDIELAKIIGIVPDERNLRKE